MSAKIRISYETDEELHAELARLDQSRWHIALEPAKGKFKRCYLTPKAPRKNAGNPDGQGDTA